MSALPALFVCCFYCCTSYLSLMIVFSGGSASINKFYPMLSTGM